MDNARIVSAAFSSRFWPRLVLAGIPALAVGTAADLFAAPFLALTSIAVAVDRSNNKDTLPVLTLLFAAWESTQGVETGRGSFLLLAAGLVARTQLYDLRPADDGD